MRLVELVKDPLIVIVECGQLPRMLRIHRCAVSVRDGEQGHRQRGSPFALSLAFYLPFTLALAFLFLLAFSFSFALLVLLPLPLPIALSIAVAIPTLVFVRYWR